MTIIEEQLQLEMDLPAVVDSESDHVIVAVLEIPFFGKKDQAKNFVDNRLRRIINSGISDNVQVRDVIIT